LRRRAERALAELGAAAPLGAVCLLVANDHEFKRLFHNTLTGKLSDVAICFLLPLLISAALGLLRDWPGSRRLAVGAVATTLLFTLLELSDTADVLYLRATGALGLGGAPLTRDPTDFLALALVPLAVAYGWRRLFVAERRPNVWRTAAGALVMVTGSLALMADSEAVVPCKRAAFTVRAEAGCGPGGLIVVQSLASDRFTISNAGALGLPSFFSSDSCVGSVGNVTGAPSSGPAPCPFRLDEGEISASQCVSPDGTVARVLSAPTACGRCYRRAALCSPMGRARSPAPPPSASRASRT
jgi:hypothetical protein